MMERQGEDETDVERIYARDGKAYSTFAEVTFTWEEFNPENLS